jgi:toxin ParE1/3/4
MARYRLSRAAGADIVDIYLHGVEEFGTAQAEHYAAGLKACFEMLADNPHLAREREELRQRPRAFRYKAHLIFYHAEAGGILILRIRHGREDWLTDD